MMLRRMGVVAMFGRDGLVMDVVAWGVLGLIHHEVHEEARRARGTARERRDEPAVHPLPRGLCITHILWGGVGEQVTDNVRMQFRDPAPEHLDTRLAVAFARQEAA